MQVFTWHSESVERRNSIPGSACRFIAARNRVYNTRRMYSYNSGSLPLLSGLESERILRRSAVANVYIRRPSTSSWWGCGHRPVPFGPPCRAVHVIHECLSCLIVALSRGIELMPARTFPYFPESGKPATCGRRNCESQWV